MERTSSKHGPRLDDELKRETESLRRGAPVESRAEESREKESPGEDQQGAEATIGGEERSWIGQDISQAEVRARSELARHLEGAVFPASRTKLLESARDNGAPDSVLEPLRGLPEEESFENVQAVWRALGGSEERRA